MRCHANARLCPIGRRLVDRIESGGWTVRAAAESAGISERTAREWLARFRAEGAPGLVDRSSAPKSVANRTDEHTVAAICALRRLRFTGPELSDLLELPLSTVSAVLKRCGMGKLGRLGLAVAVRYERERPGELIHIDVKKLGRIQGGAGKRVWGGSSHYNRTFTDRAGKRRNTVGWDFVHIAIADATRLAYAEVLSDESGRTAVGFLRRAAAFYARHGITVKRVCSPTTARPTSPPSTRSLAARSASATSAPGHGDHRPTAKPVSQDERAVRRGGEAPRACRSDSGKGMPEIEISSEPPLAQSAVLLACVRFVDRRVAGGPTKVT